MHLIPFKPHHLEEMADYGGQDWVRAFDVGAYAERFLEGPCFSGAVAGEIIGSAGIGLADGRRGFAWGIFSNRAKHHGLAITRAAKRYFREQDRFDRVEAYVDPEFAVAIRWIEMLGFSRETPEPMRKFFADGRSAFLYGLVRD